jgi:putative ABC transport system permease protein
VFKHYFRIALRSLLRKKLYTFINVIGLAIGLALCLVIIGHVSYEFSFEDMHVNRDNIYRVEGEFRSQDEQYSSARVMAPLGHALVDDVPGVDNAAVFRVHQITTLKVGEKTHIVRNEYEGRGYAHGNKLIFADGSYFDVFTFPLQKGNPQTALSEPNTVLVSADAVDTYFDGLDPVGQLVTINDSVECTVRGVLENIPQNTQLYSHFIVSYATLGNVGIDRGAWTTFGADYVYLLLDEGANPDEIETNISSVVSRRMGVEEAPNYRFWLQPLKDIYFGVYGSGNQGELYPAGEASFIYEVGAIALFVLLLAIANFINLSTAKSADRMKEVGVRKVFGAFRRHLIRQFLGESVLIATSAMLISVLVYELFKIHFEEYFPREMLVDFYENPMMLASLVLLVLFVGVVAGLYPAVYLSRHKPIAVLQGKKRMKSSRSALRRVLVVFQFVIAVVFVFCTTVIVRQVDYMTAMELGFNRENVLILDFVGEDAAHQCQAMKTEVLTSGVALAASATSGPPGRATNTFYGFYTDEERQREDRVTTTAFKVDYDFLSLFGLEMVQGEAFSAASAASVSAVIVSESLAKEIDRENPVGTKLYAGNDNFYEIVGVVKDFHGSTLNYAAEYKPILLLKPDEGTSLAIKLPDDDVTNSLAAIKDIWHRVLPGFEFEFTFLDDEIEDNYRDYRGQADVFFSIAVFAILIACMGIFGLVSYTAEQRTREIGVRKVLGASVNSIVGLLSKEFVILIGIACLIAWPLGYLIMQDFLRYFPEKVAIGPLSYAFVGGVALFFALLTAGVQSVKAPNRFTRCGTNSITTSGEHGITIGSVI